MATDLKRGSHCHALPGLFASTHWSVVVRAQDKSEAALNTLCAAYREPLVGYARNRGHSPHDAEDLVQGFLAALLRRDFLKNVDQKNGKFRSFLLHSLKNYLIDQGEKANAQIRGGGQRLASLQETNEDGQWAHDATTRDPAPDMEFDRAWARSVLANSLRRLEAECSLTGHASLCQELQPAMFADEDASPYRELAQKLGMTEGAVRIAALRIRKRLGSLIRDEVSQTLADGAELEEELAYLISLFGR